MYTFEKGLLHAGWMHGLIVNLGTHEFPEFRVRDMTRLLRLAYHEWDKADPISQSEWVQDVVVGPHEVRLMKSACGYGDFTFQDALAGRLEDLMDREEAFDLLCHLEVSFADTILAD